MLHCAIESAFFQPVHEKHEIDEDRYLKIEAVFHGTGKT